jgi:hypothetical protein
MKTNYTPAPWRAFEEIPGRAFVIDHLDGSAWRNIASVTIFDETDRANARLIAAAAELLEALEAIVNSSDYGEPDEGPDERPLMAAARAAIAKAKQE